MSAPPRPTVPVFATPPQKNKTNENTIVINQVIDITVEFSDELLLETSSSGLTRLPTLPLNNGGEAVVVGGTGTREWLFSYAFLGAGDYGYESGGDVSVLDIANDSFPFPAMVNCTGGCRASNWNGVTANLSVRGYSIRE